jgi:iron complex transport system substrate-binding protein
MHLFRSFGVAVALALAAATVQARPVTDSASRTVEVPDNVSRVFAAGPPASVLLNVLAPQKMIGWVRTPSDAEKPFLLPSVRDLPQLGRLTGRGGTLNLEQLLADKPDLIIDFGSINDTYKSLADRVQNQTGIPYLLVDGRFENTAAALRLLGSAIGAKERSDALVGYAEETFALVDRIVAAVPADKRPRVYLARGPRGLETSSRGSINTEIIERVGATNVVEGFGQRGGIVNASAEQVIAWNPDTIVTLDRDFAQNVKSRPEWSTVAAVQNNRVLLSPNLPYGFVDAPPSVNRLIGLRWLLHKLYPDKTPGNLREEIAVFYKVFYQVEPAKPDLDRLLEGTGD